jgi:hypothetical protein
MTKAQPGFMLVIIALTGPSMKTRLLDGNEPVQRGSILSVFSLADFLGSGLGRSVAGLLSGTLGLTLRSTLRIPCSVLPLIVSLYFFAGVKKLREPIKRGVSEMKALVRA